MTDRPTFSLVDDWVALADLDHITFRIYCILRTNAEFGRNGMVNHTLHVTASWVVDCTQHWKKPLAVSTVRKHMQRLVEQGILKRANDPLGGLGVIYSFVVDPGEGYEHPVNGFEHAKRISRSRGTTSIYRRVPLGDVPPEKKPSPARPGASEIGDVFEGAPEPEAGGDAFGFAPIGAEREPAADSPFDEEPEFDASGLDGLESAPSRPTPSMVEFAVELERATSQHPEEKLHLLAGACQRIAEAVAPALERGWDPKKLARRLSGELNPKVHSPERLLMTKVPDIGNPPQGQHADGMMVMNGQVVDPADVDFGFGYDKAPAGGATKTFPFVRPRRGSSTDQLARMARGLVD